MVRQHEWIQKVTVCSGITSHISDECLGSAYKARMYGDGRTTWVKEVAHPVYTGNRGSVGVTSDIKAKWMGFKTVMYNYQSNGKTQSCILSGLGGTSTQNIVGFRTDDSTWQFKHLSVREIVPP